MKKQKLSHTGDRKDNWHNSFEGFGNTHLKFKTCKIWLINTTARNVYYRYTE